MDPEDLETLTEDLGTLVEDLETLTEDLGTLVEGLGGTLIGLRLGRRGGPHVAYVFDFYSAALS